MGQKTFDFATWSPAKRRSILFIAAAQVAGLSVWFSSAAVLPDLRAGHSLSPAAEAAYSSAVQLGFVAGTLLSAVLGLADRFDPRRIFALSAALAGCATLALLLVDPAGPYPVALRALAGGALAGVYPVGLKLAAGWGTRDRGLLVGLLVGALTLGTASPHLLAGLEWADWRLVIAATGAAALAAGGLILGCALGPYHTDAGRFRPSIALLAWTDRRLRLVNLGYLGHMWELYAMWAWIAAAVAASGLGVDAEGAALIAFAVIGIGAVGCVGGGLLADRIGRVEVTIRAMAASGASALLAALLLDGPALLLLPVLLIWGLTIIADSAQFSALIADFAPAGTTGTLLTVQTSQGFLLTFFTVQAVPLLAERLGWSATLALLALGPAAGIAAMRRLPRATA